MSDLGIDDFAEETWLRDVLRALERPASTSASLADLRHALEEEKESARRELDHFATRQGWRDGNWVLAARASLVGVKRGKVGEGRTRVLSVPATAPEKRRSWEPDGDLWGSPPSDAVGRRPVHRAATNTGRRTIRLSEIAEDVEWATSAPWTNSLAWLASARAWTGHGDDVEVADRLERCPRCNWPGRRRELVGRDDGRNLERLLRSARPGAVGSMRPILSEYLLPGATLDHLHGYRDPDGRYDGRCVLCVGRGYLEPRSREDVVHDELRSSKQISYRHARLSSDRVVRRDSVVAATQGLDGIVEAEADSDVTMVLRGDGREEFASATDGWSTDELATGGSVAEEPRAAARVLAAAVRFATTGDVGIQPAWVRSAVQAYLEEAWTVVTMEDASDLTTHRLLEIGRYFRQLAANASASGGGRKNTARAGAFAERDGVILNLLLLGYPEGRIARSFGLSESQVRSLKIVKGVRQAVRWVRASLIHSWHADGRSTREIAAICDVNQRTVQVTLRKPKPLPGLSEEALALLNPSNAIENELDRSYQRYVDRALIEWAAPRLLLAETVERSFYGVPSFYGFPHHRPGEPYHTWEPRWDDVFPWLVEGRTGIEPVTLGKPARVGEESLRWPRAGIGVSAPTMSRFRLHETSTSTAEARSGCGSDTSQGCG
jgi:DNA-binding CsgD family transcriptional regulator